MVMDLEGQISACESVEDNEGIKQPSEKLISADENKVGSNGNYAADKKDIGNDVLEGTVKSPDGEIGKSSTSSPSPSPGGTKGYGLKKWKRIRRDVVKEGASNADNSKILKRGLPNLGANLDRAMQFSGGTKQNSKGSVSSTNAVVRSPGNALDLFAGIGDSGIGTGTDSENSEDRSSKSSTGASAPKMRYEMPVMKGFASADNSMRILSGKNVVNTGQEGKVGAETSKKLRGELVKIEKENSHSSMESDSRSSIFVFMQGINSATCNGRQSGRSSKHDGENSDEAQGSERQPSEEFPGASHGRNGVDLENNSHEDLGADSSWGIKEEESEHNGHSSDQDPLVESILTLQFAQEALEKEIQKFRELEEGSIPDDQVLDDSAGKLQFSDEKSFDSLETDVTSLKHNINILESKLYDATALLKVKEAKIVELQDPIFGSRSPKVDSGSTMELHPENYRDLEIELEGLFKQKIEAEVEYLAISRAVQKLRVAVVDQITILEEQKTEQARMLNKLGDAEVKAAMLKGEAEKLENYYEDIVIADETVLLGTKISKYTVCVIIQLMVLVAVLTLYFRQDDNYSKVVPT